MNPALHQTLLALGYIGLLIVAVACPVGLVVALYKGASQPETKMLPEEFQWFAKDDSRELLVIKLDSSAAFSPPSSRYGLYGLSSNPCLPERAACPQPARL